MDRDPIIPEGLEPQPEPIEFRPIEAFVPEMVMRRGDYRREDVALVILAACHRDYERELDEVVLGDLKFWAAPLYAEKREPPAPDGADDQYDPATHVAELIEDQQMRHFALQIGPPEETAQGYVWMIDKAIAARTIHWYTGGDSVSVSTNNGTSVKLRRYGYDPLWVPPSRENKPAPGGCSIKAPHAANYNIAGAGTHYKTTKF